MKQFGNATTDLKAQKRAELQAEAEGDDVKAAQVLPERIAVVITQGDYHKALYETSARGYQKLVQILGEHSAEVNAKGRENDSSLQIPSRERHEDTDRVQLKRGVDLMFKKAHIILGFGQHHTEDGKIMLICCIPKAPM
ncbi:unnamed protein product [Clonostachys chloroleuca]|uniref:Uncharacterized protein n=1 Tax=Clonostachys chloroleuca TaxID=1926264 RepID=A0AA35M854_9HYPO|nr:unnamed protein product [Clonostachys chloroleuca]